MKHQNYLLLKMGSPIVLSSSSLFEQFTSIAPIFKIGNKIHYIMRKCEALVRVIGNFEPPNQHLSDTPKLGPHFLL